MKAPPRDTLKMRSVPLLLAAFTASARAYSPNILPSHPATAAVAADPAAAPVPRYRGRRRSSQPCAVAEVMAPQPEAPEPVPPALADQAEVGVLLLNLGGPDTLDNVEPFLYNLFADPEIITLPSFLGWANPIIAWLIAKSRAPQSREGYETVVERVGCTSPQLPTTEKQGELLTAALKERGVNAKYYIAMRYWKPFTEEALEAIKADGIEKLVVLPLYPQFSISTSGSSLRLLEREFYADQSLRQVRNVVIPAWYNREGYVNSLARTIMQKCDLSEDPSEPHVFFSAHGLPKKYIESLADPYKTQTEATVAFVMNRMRQLGYTNPHSLAYQSRVGPVEWLQPYTEDSIKELADSGVQNLVVVPISFVSDHIETIEEIDVEYYELAMESGIKRWERTPTLGTDAEFIEDLAEAVVEVLPVLEEAPKSDINEGRPVSLRVVNDLVQLRGKEEEIEYGPVRYEVSEPPPHLFGRTLCASLHLCTQTHILLTPDPALAYV